MIKVAVSACLLGENVRYDGGNKYIDLVTYFNPDIYQLAGICPEVAMGLSIPRAPVQVVNTDNQIKLVQVNNPKLDYTSQMERWFTQNLGEFNQYAGFILKSKSPSCGNQTTANFQFQQDFLLADGLFVHLLKQYRPDIAIIDELQVHDSLCLAEFKGSM